MRCVWSAAVAAAVISMAQLAPAQAAPDSMRAIPGASAAPAHDSAAAPRDVPRRDRAGIAPATDLRQRRAIEHDDAYYTRLTIHRWGSYAMLPLFAGEYLLGRRLLNGGDVPGWIRNAHGTVAGAIGALFAVNTVTGVMNLWAGRDDGDDRARRLLHSALMLASDAGFLYTASLVEDDRGGRDLSRHRAAALTSIGLSAAGTALMWIGRN